MIKHDSKEIEQKINFEEFKRCRRDAGWNQGSVNFRLGDLDDCLVIVTTKSQKEQKKLKKLSVLKNFNFVNLQEDKRDAEFWRMG